MTDQPTPSHIEISIEESSPPMVTFTIDPQTLLFQTHKSEDLSVLQNRISQLEIHELLMQINLDLIPRVQVIQRAVLWYMIGLAISSLLLLVMLLLQEIRLLKPIIFCFSLTHLWIFGVLLSRKFVYDYFIKRAIRSKGDLFASKGLNWKVRNSFFAQFYRVFCSLELHLVEQSEHSPEPVDNHIVAANELMFARIYKTQSAQPDTSMRKRVTTFINFTLGPGVSKAFPGPETVRNYTFLEVGVTESNRFRRKSRQGEQVNIVVCFQKISKKYF